eukprot:GILI01054681.1.p1 GENE.GILI01054681.1~~GILI01054681.1.p1  ORF type:complete len:149 (-),score=11.13 GILI01054681.1:48-461(-)
MSSFPISAFCFLTAIIAFFIAWCFGSSSLAAFTIPCVLNGWDRAEKATAVWRAALAYTFLGIIFVFKGWLDLRKSKAEGSDGSQRYASEPNHHNGSAPLVGSRSSRRSGEEGEPLVTSKQYGGTDVEMRRVKQDPHQ